MALLTPTELRGFLETDLADARLQDLMDAAEARINGAVGAVGAQTLVYDALGRNDVPHGRELWLPRNADTITSVSEQSSYEGDVTELVEADYTLHEGRRLIRLTTCWAPLVTVVYEPDVDLTMRKGVQLELVKIALKFTGAKSEKYGDVTTDIGDRAAMIESAMLPLKGGGQAPLF
jgi:hypothetical protein